MFFSGFADKTLVELFFIFPADPIFQEGLSLDRVFLHRSIDSDPPVIERIVNFILHRIDSASL